MTRVRHLAVLVIAVGGLPGCGDPARPDGMSAPDAPDFAKGGTGAITVSDLGTLGGNSNAEDVNDNGAVVGWSGDFGGIKRAFLWTPTAPRGTMGTLQDIGTLGGPGAAAYAINNAAQVVGVSTLVAGGPGRAFLRTADGQMVDLGTLGGAYAHASDINEIGQVAGYSATASGARHAFRWTPAAPGATTGQMEDLGTLPGGTYSVAWGINAVGHVVGHGDTETGEQHAILWTAPGAAMDLGTLEGGTTSTAEALDDNGNVVGYGTIAGAGPCHPFVWTGAGGMSPLGIIAGDCARARSINNQGLASGSSTTAQGPYHAVIWTIEGGAVKSVRDLGVLSGTRYSVAKGMSGSIGGVVQLAGLSRTTSGVERATLWTVRLP